MIRHSSSFFISIVVHLSLLLIVYFVWSSYSDTKEEYQKESFCVQLCKVKHEQEAENLKKEPKKIEEPKKPLEQKTQKKTVQERVKKEALTVEEALPKVQEAKEIKEAEVVEVIEEPKAEEQKAEEKKAVFVAPKTVQTQAVKKEPAEPKNKQSRAVDAKEEYLKINTQKISELIRENLYYPMAARKRGITGRVSVKFTICPDGKLKDIKIIDSSSDILSRAALRTIEELSGKFPKPGVNIILTLPIDYSLK